MSLVTILYSPIPETRIRVLVVILEGTVPRRTVVRLLSHAFGHLKAEHLSFGYLRPEYLGSLREYLGSLRFAGRFEGSVIQGQYDVRVLSLGFSAFKGLQLRDSIAGVQET